MKSTTTKVQDVSTCTHGENLNPHQRHKKSQRPLPSLSLPLYFAFNLSHSLSCFFSSFSVSQRAPFYSYSRTEQTIDQEDIKEQFDHERERERVKAVGLDFA